jgi:hypothetical protein
MVQPEVETPPYPNYSPAASIHDCGARWTGTEAMHILVDVVAALRAEPTNAG